MSGGVSGLRYNACMTRDQLVTVADFRIAAEQSPDAVDFLDSRREQALDAAIRWVEEELNRVLIDRVDMIEFDPEYVNEPVNVRIPDPTIVVGVTYLPESDTVLAPRTVIAVNSRVDEGVVSLYPQSGEWPSGERYMLEVRRGLPLVKADPAFVNALKDVVLAYAVGSFTDTMTDSGLAELRRRLQSAGRTIPLAV